MELSFFEFDDETPTKDDQMNIDWRSDDEDDDHNETSLAETKAFWESQHELLQEALSRRSSTEARIQRDTEEVVRKMQAGGGVICRRNCVLKNIADRLRELGYNSSLCKSKWRRSPEIPSGEHHYIDVVVESKSGKKGPIRVVIEPNFRAEFDVARANSEYNGLVSKLPEIFVGKSEKLRNVIRIMCGATKKCIKDNKMHMAPWRKHKYMQSKWLGTCERIEPSLLFSPAAMAAERPLRPRASILTFDLHCSTAVKVL